MAQAKLPVDFTMPDTEDLAREIRELRRMQFPFNVTQRAQAISNLNAFAIEWGIRKFPGFDISNIEDSIQKFERVKGEILRLMRKELRKLSERDSKSMKSILSGFSGFDDEVPK